MSFETVAKSAKTAFESVASAVHNVMPSTRQAKFAAAVAGAVAATSLTGCVVEPVHFSGYGHHRHYDRW